MWDSSNSAGKPYVQPNALAVLLAQFWLAIFYDSLTISIMCTRLCPELSST